MNQESSSAPEKQEASKAKMLIDITKDKVNLNCHMPCRWLIFGAVILLIWRVPELWNAVQVALPLFTK